MRYDTMFPLTLAFSLGEREPQSLRRDQFDVFALTPRCKRFSLSPGERAGVREKSVSQISTVSPLQRPEW